MARSGSVIDINPADLISVDAEINTKPAEFWFRELKRRGEITKTHFAALVMKDAETAFRNEVLPSSGLKSWRYLGQGWKWFARGTDEYVFLRRHIAHESKHRRETGDAALFALELGSKRHPIFAKNKKFLKIPTDQLSRTPGRVSVGGGAHWFASKTKKEIRRGAGYIFAKAVDHPGNRPYKFLAALGEKITKEILPRRLRDCWQFSFSSSFAPERDT